MKPVEPARHLAPHRVVPRAAPAEIWETQVVELRIATTRRNPLVPHRRLV